MASFWDERIQQSIALDTRLQVGNLPGPFPPRICPLLLKPRHPQATNDAVRSSRNFISRTASRASGVSRPVGDPLFDDTERHPFTPAYF